MSKVKKEYKAESVKLSVKLNHPNQSFRLGKHVIGVTPSIYELSAEEMAELDSIGPKAWLVSHKIEKVLEKPAQGKN